MYIVSEYYTRRDIHASMYISYVDVCVCVHGVIVAIFTSMRWAGPIRR